MRRWQPDLDLDRLLDALETDLLSATEQEIRWAFFEARCSVSLAASEVRELIAGVDRERDGHEFGPRDEEAAAHRMPPARTYLI
jgi:hypothetical protein